MFERRCRGCRAGQHAESLDGLSRESLLKSALELYDGAACPVCDTPFEPGAFTGHLAGKLAQLKDVSKRRAALEAELKPILTPSTPQVRH